MLIIRKSPLTGKFHFMFILMSPIKFLKGNFTGLTRWQKDFIKAGITQQEWEHLYYVTEGECENVPEKYVDRIIESINN